MKQQITLCISSGDIELLRQTVKELKKGREIKDLKVLDDKITIHQSDSFYGPMYNVPVEYEDPNSLYILGHSYCWNQIKQDNQNKYHLQVVFGKARIFTKEEAKKLNKK